MSCSGFAPPSREDAADEFPLPSTPSPRAAGEEGRGGGSLPKPQTSLGFGEGGRGGVTTSPPSPAATIPREDPQREKKERNLRRERAKKTRNVGLPALREPPTLPGPPPSSPPPLSLPLFHFSHLLYMFSFLFLFLFFFLVLFFFHFLIVRKFS